MIIHHFERSSNHSSGSRCGNPTFNGSFEKRSLSQGMRALFCMFALLLLCSPLIARAQELSATLSGVVTDSSGAVIPHASVAIALGGVNGSTRIVETDGSGNYVATNLTPGTYSITVTATGFETYKANNIVLDVAEKHAVNVEVKTGATSTTVVVEDNPVSVDTETGGQAGTITGVQIQELEISSRNFEQLITLQPGVVNQLGDEPNSSGIAISVNGARTSANNWTVDGADINDSGSNATVVNEPSMDSIQEITLERGNYDAGYGRSGGGQILVATRSGGSTFHGEGYEYVRNTMFDANDWLNEHSQVANGQPNKPGENHHNVYGFTIGGPIYIPKVYNESKNKTFFFWSEDWHKITSAASSQTITTPTTGEVQGTFAGNITGQYPQATYDPATNTSTIPTSAFSKNAQVYLTGLFTPNANSSGQLTLNLPSETSYRNDIVRIDHYFNDKLHFYARGMNDVMPVSEPMGLWAGNNYPGAAAASVDSPGKNVVGNLTWSISPKVVNELEFVYAQGTYHSSFNGSQFANSASALGALQPNTEQFNDPYGRLPAINITGVTGFSPGSTPWKERNLDRSYFDNLSLAYGKHTLRFGFQLQQMLKSENAVAGGATFGFGTGNTGDVPFADFLLGNVVQYTQQNKDTIPDLQYFNSEAYIQDDWKLNHKLTLNLGLRWSSFPSPNDKAEHPGQLRSSALQRAAGTDDRPGKRELRSGPICRRLQPGTCHLCQRHHLPAGPGTAEPRRPILRRSNARPSAKTIDPTYSANFAPRVGFAYNPDGHGVMSIRGGFGIFYDRVLNGIFEQSAFYDPPEVQSVTVNNTNFDKPLAVAGATNYGPNLLWTTGTPAFKVPSYSDYNLTVERQLLPSTIASVAYVGGKARHLIGEFDMNQPDDRIPAGRPRQRRCERAAPLRGIQLLRRQRHGLYQQLQLAADRGATSLHQRPDGGRSLYVVEIPDHQLGRSCRRSERQYAVRNHRHLQHEDGLRSGGL